MTRKPGNKWRNTIHSTHQTIDECDKMHDHSEHEECSNKGTAVQTEENQPTIPDGQAYAKYKKSELNDLLLAEIRVIGYKLEEELDRLGKEASIRDNNREELIDKIITAQRRLPKV